LKIFYNYLTIEKHLEKIKIKFKIDALALGLFMKIKL
jgi:hypothetical protein